MRKIYQLKLIILTIFLSLYVFVFSAPALGAQVTYCSHIANVGWLSWVSDGQTSGSPGSGNQMEAVKIQKVGFPSTYHIDYQAHVSYIGWQGWVSDGQIAGTTGEAKAIEAIQIKLRGFPSNYHVKYRAYVQNSGWQGWVEDGTMAGTTNQAKAIEALQIQVYYSVNPILSIGTSASGPWGTSAGQPQLATFYFKGSGFTPYGKATQQITGSDNLTSSIDIKGDGTLYWQYTSLCTTPLGDYTIRVVDDATGKATNYVYETVTSSPDCENTRITISPLSGLPGTIFTVNGQGFTPNSTVTSHLKKPDGTEFSTLQIPTYGQGEYTWPIDSAEFVPGTYHHWVFDDNTGKRSNIVDFDIITADLVIIAPIAEDRVGKAPFDVSFHVTGISTKFYEWDFDGDSQTDATTYDNRISHIFKDEGEYRVKIAAIAFDGTRYEKEIVITVLPSDEINKDINFIPFHPSSDSISSEVMKGGKAVRYYRILDHLGAPMAENKIYYSFNGGLTVLSGDIDDQGFLNIITPAVTTDADYSLTITDEKGTLLATAVNNPPAFSVHVTDREFTENYKILFGTGGSLGIGGPGVKIGPLKLKTIGAGLNGGRNISSSIVLRTTGINTDVEVENSLGHEFGIEASAGLFAKTWGVKTRPSVNAGFEGEVNKGSSLSTRYKFPNFFNSDQFDHDDQILASAALFLENALNGCRYPHRLGIDQIIKDRIISELIERVSNLSAYEEGIGNTVSLRGKGSLGADIELKNPLGISAGSLLNINLSAFDGEYIYERTGEEDSNGAKRTTQAVTHNLDIGSFKASIAQKFWGDKRRNDTPRANLGNLVDYNALKIEGEESITLVHAGINTMTYFSCIYH
jgi:hypothetical protein